jgi:hypothetical protein
MQSHEVTENAPKMIIRDEATHEVVRKMFAHQLLIVE